MYVGTLLFDFMSVEVDRSDVFKLASFHAISKRKLSYPKAFLSTQIAYIASGMVWGKPFLIAKTELRAWQVKNRKSPFSRY